MSWWLALALAADLSGTWIGSFEPRPGVNEDLAFRFEQKGAVLTGKQYGDQSSSPLIKGTVSGELVSFVLVRAEQAGNEIHQTQIRFTGRLVGEELELTREREKSTRSGSGAIVTLKNNVRQTFRLKRLTGN